LVEIRLSTKFVTKKLINQLQSMANEIFSIIPFDLIFICFSFLIASSFSF